jgi:hypothetical protein
MKKLVTGILLLLLTSASASAQKVTYDNDTIKVDKNAYAVMKKKNAGAMRSDYAVYSLSGTELIYFKSNLRPWRGTGFMFGNDELYYEVNFTASGSKAELTNTNGKGFAKLIVENALVKGNAVDPEAEKRFLRLNNGYTPSVSSPKEPAPTVVVNINNSNGTAPANNNSTGTVPAPPKSKSPVTIDGKKIMRDGEVIGKFRQDTTSSNFSQKTVLVTVYSSGGEKIAEASAPVANPQEWSIMIMSENKSYSIMYDSPGEREELFRWLADKNYLTK